MVKHITKSCKYRYVVPLLNVYVALILSQRVEVTILGVNKAGIAYKEFISTVRYKQNKP